MTALPEQFDEATCRQPEFRPRRPDFGERYVPTLWESGIPHEPLSEVSRRWDRAVVLCRHCPVLNLCAQYADGLIERGLKVDGVIAGVRPELPKVQMSCRGCGVPLYPRQSTIRPAGCKREYASATCRSCWDANHNGRSHGARPRAP
ncbi:hypothetical protein OS128_05240 [Corynebacterium sp. P5848]|uniref:hypothetical protein n=1 Tax=Corynebacterium marambiense TaxID=2765364 RepID=UPI002260A365|nr:hypothetical protein [Corynebacterium marambiense]MCX7542315.1 hypothetical protein [Corynebacterium marambiense]